MNAFGNIPSHGRNLTGHESSFSEQSTVEVTLENARKCLREGNLLEAERAGEEMLQISPGSSSARLIMARVFQGLGENEKALSMAQAIEDISSLSASDQIEFHLTLGLALRSIGQLKASISKFQLAIEVDATDCRPYLHLANLMRLTDDSGQAARVVKKGIESCPRTEELEMFAHILADWPDTYRQ